MHAGEAIWKLHALITYLDRKSDPSTQQLLKEFGHDSVASLTAFMKYHLPPPDQLNVLLSMADSVIVQAKREAYSARQTDGPQKSLNADATTAIEHCDYILANVDDLPDAADEYGASISAKAASMKQSIQQRGSVTPKMLAALENMRSGMDKWLNND